MEFHHIPVLFDEVMEWMQPRADGVYADGTLGGGGHSEGILHLSGGEQQMLALGSALMCRPKVLMMDEPSLGLEPLVIKDIFKIIQEINRQGMTVLLIEQNANMALKIADIAYVLETGRITMNGTGKEVLENPDIKAAYLGKTK